MHTAYLITDELLRDLVVTPKYNGGGSLRVYLDNFVCEVKKREMQVRDTDGHVHKVCGMSDFPAHAKRFSFRLPPKRELVDAFFDGHLHLAWFADDRLVWVAKNLAVIDYQEYQDSNFFTMINPRFLASGILDLRSTESPNPEMPVRFCAHDPVPDSTVTYWRAAYADLLELAEELRGYTHEWDWKYGEEWNAAIARAKAVLGDEPNGG